MPEGGASPHGRYPFSRSSAWRSSSRPEASLDVSVQVTLVPLSNDVVERSRAVSVCPGYRAIGESAGR